MQVLVCGSTPIFRAPLKTAHKVQMHSLIQYFRRHLPSTGAVQTRAAKSQHKLDQDRPVWKQKQNGRVRLAVVGDVHGQWTPADAAALRLLAADAVLWVGEWQHISKCLGSSPDSCHQSCRGHSMGYCLSSSALQHSSLSFYNHNPAGDIGNEDVGLVQQIAALVSLVAVKGSYAQHLPLRHVNDYCNHYHHHHHHRAFKPCQARQPNAVAFEQVHSMIVAAHHCCHHH